MIDKCLLRFGLKMNLMKTNFTLVDVSARGISCRKGNTKEECKTEWQFDGSCEESVRRTVCSCGGKPTLTQGVMYFKVDTNDYIS